MTESSAVTPEKAAEWAALAGRLARRLGARGAQGASVPARLICEALPALLAEREQLLARLEQQRADLATAYEQLHNAEQRINDGIKLAVAARTAVPDAPYTGVGWHALLTALIEPEDAVKPNAGTLNGDGRIQAGDHG